MFFPCTIYFLQCFSRLRALAVMILMFNETFYLDASSIFHFRALCRFFLTLSSLTNCHNLGLALLFCKVFIRFRVYVKPSLFINYGGMSILGMRAFNVCFTEETLKSCNEVTTMPLEFSYFSKLGAFNNISYYFWDAKLVCIIYLSW